MEFFKKKEKLEGFYPLRYQPSFLVSYFIQTKWFNAKNGFEKKTALESLIAVLPSEISAKAKAILKAVIEEVKNAYEPPKAWYERFDIYLSGEDYEYRINEESWNRIYEDACNIAMQLIVKLLEQEGIIQKKIKTEKWEEV